MSSTKLRTEFTTFRPEGFLSAANATEFLERLTVEVKSSVPLSESCLNLPNWTKPLRYLKTNENLKQKLANK